LRLMGVPTSEVGYTSITTGRGDHEVHKGHVVALAKKNLYLHVLLQRLGARKKKKIPPELFMGYNCINTILTHSE
jgi:hypothetical protein